jgi:hypothetical protein
MAVSLKHAFQSGVADVGGSTLIQPQAHWNAEHVLLLANNKLLGNTTGSTGSQEIGVSGELTLAGAELGVGSTLTAKSLSAVTLLDGYTEEIYSITGTNPAISPNNASIQTWQLAASQTPTAGTWAAGQSITLMINDTTSGTSYTITWTSMSIVWVGGVAPVLTPAGGYTVIQLWKVGTTIYGALIGQVA